MPIFRQQISKFCHVEESEYEVTKRTFVQRISLDILNKQGYTCMFVTVHRKIFLRAQIGICPTLINLLPVYKTFSM